MFACYDHCNMDEQHTLFATKPDIAPRTERARRIALAIAAAGIALLLCGCDNSQRVDQLEQRVNEVEAKANAADKRARTAEALAAETQPIVQPDPAPQNELDADNPDDPNGQSDSNDSDAGPPPPMADNGRSDPGAAAMADNGKV